MILKLPVILFILIHVCGIFVSLSEALKVGEEGVCVVKISVHKTRQRAVTINKWCGKKKCVKNKIENYKVPVDRAVCCNGYEYNVNGELCSPTCSTGCIGGRCTAPDTCHCDPPSYLDPEQKNACLTAPPASDSQDQQCNPSCVNSECINQTCICDNGYEKLNDYSCFIPTCNQTCVNSDCVNQTCVCKDGFQKINETFCQKCDAGYKLNGSVCIPECRETCINSTCDAPDQCSCLQGFQRKNEYTCEPICNCVNSTCIGPYNCSCFEGYERLNDTVCKPRCDSCDGVCIGPNICQCDEGFANNNGSCKLLCEDCENGVCSAPNVCLCNEGFVRNETVSQCVRDCRLVITTEVSHSEKYYAIDKKKKCPKSETDCTKNVKAKIKNFDSKSKRCCLKKKTSEKRIACCENWEYSKKEDICIPQCHPPCKDGECIAPNSCKCSPPLVLNGTSCVNPVCEPPCVNALCRANNVCECTPELVYFNTTHCVTNCEPGFKNDPISLECVPSCDSPCLNGKCTAPNFCTCTEGFVQKDNYTCVPDCTPSCVNGNCTSPNTCTCNEGYETDIQNSYNCLPKCEPNCPNNSICVAPDKCQCLQGYQAAGNTNDCKPVCQNCVHGECVAPNQCQCNPGYSEHGDRCSPQCPDVNCDHGVCVAPNQCQCNPGYSEHGDRCSPQCPDVNCDNGVCSEPNKCICNKGYDFNVTLGSCEPVCNPPCVNSTCRYIRSSLTICECNAGYETTADPAVCQPSCGPCENGVCVAPYTCLCKDGNNMTKGKCPSKSVDCETCKTNCTEDYDCFCSDGRPCYYTPPETPAASTTGLAGFQLTWAVAGAVALLLVILLIIVMTWLYRQKQPEDKLSDQNGKPYGSVMYTVPDTLHAPSAPSKDQIEESAEMIVLDSSIKETNDRLLATNVTAKDDFCIEDVCNAYSDGKQTSI